eukprot:916130-Amphidinium_carterae.1
MANVSRRVSLHGDGVASFHGDVGEAFRPVSNYFDTATPEAASFCIILLRELHHSLRICV